MRLYEFAPTRSIRVRWTLQELGVDFEAVTVNLAAGEHRRPEFLKLNSAGKLPVLVDGDFVLTESVAIVLYLAEKYSYKGLLPTDLKQRAQVYRWLLFTATELEQPLWRIARHTALYPEHLRLPAEVSLARQDFTDMAAVMEEYMQGRKFLVGDTLTIADIVGAYTLDWANEVQLLDDFPHLLSYMKRMYARPNAPLHIAEAIGGMMTKMPDTPVPFWLYYFNVDALDAAIVRVTENGGQVLMGPHQVPGGQWIAQCTDPQGAMFALLSPKLRSAS